MTAEILSFISFLGTSELARVQSTRTCKYGQMGIRPPGTLKTV